MTTARQRRIISLLQQLAPHEGYTLSALPGLKFMRANTDIARTPVMYDPCIVIVCQGRKRGFVGDRSYVYDAHHYLVLSVPLPFESETEASPAEPMLAVSVSIDLTTAAELVLALEGQSARHGAPPAGILSTPLDDPMSDALLRLLEALQSESDAGILGPGIVRELVYRVLTGPRAGPFVPR